jgi:hypothetical protein
MRRRCRKQRCERHERHTQRATSACCVPFYSPPAFAGWPRRCGGPMLNAFPEALP